MDGVHHKGEDRKEVTSDSPIVKDGWVRVRLLSVTEKRALWTKRYLVLHVGELFVYKSEDKSDCLHHLILGGCKIKILKMKAERCDLMIFYNSAEQSNNQIHNYIKSNPITNNPQGSSRIVISIRESIDTWMSQFESCLGKDINVSTITTSDSHDSFHTQTPFAHYAISQTLACDSSNDSDVSATNQLHWEREISEKLKNSTRVKELLQDLIFLFHPVELNWVSRIMKLEMGVLHFYKEENHQITLQSMIYLAGCEITLDSQQKDNPIFRIKRKNKNPLFSTYTPSGDELNEFFNDCFIDIQFSNKIIAKKSVEIIEKAIELNIMPLEDLVPLTAQQSQAIYECDYQFLSPSQEFTNLQPASSIPTPALIDVDPFHPVSSSNSILSTFNILLSRYFADIQHSEPFLEEVHVFLKSKLAKLPRPDFLGGIEVLDLDFGTLSFQVLDIKSVRNPENAQRIIGELNFKSEGAIEAEISTKLNLQILSQTLAEVSVTAYITLSSISGKLHFHNPPQINSRFELFFSQLPNYEIDVDVQFTEKKFSFSTTIPQLKQYFIDTLRNSIRERIVYPNKITFFIPFAGRPLDMRIEQVDDVASLLPTATKIELFKLSISRFIDEVLQLGKKQVISEIFSSDCIINGFSPFQPVFNGLNGVGELVSLFQQAFPNPVFEIHDLLESESRINFKWKAEGRMVGRFWDRSDPDDNVFILSGFMSCTSEYIADNFVFQTAKLKTVDIHWDTNVLHQILSLPKANSNVYL